ncbi:hypothetical protein DTO280E4_190 [Paecilomyces variotii]|nr:hypothetical protein DTO280E4_190 [Paecilomyces variotii]
MNTGREIKKKLESPPQWNYRERYNPGRDCLYLEIGHRIRDFTLQWRISFLFRIRSKFLYSAQPGTADPIGESPGFVHITAYRWDRRRWGKRNVESMTLMSILYRPFRIFHGDSTYLIGLDNNKSERGLIKMNKEN